MTTRRSRRNRSHAQALVEFALVVPWFFLLLFGIIEAGQFIFYYETLSNATREGARYAIVNGANTLGCPSGPPAPGSSGVRYVRCQRLGPCPPIRDRPSQCDHRDPDLDPGQRPRVDRERHCPDDLPRPCSPRASP